MQLPEGFEPITPRNAQRIADGDFEEVMLAGGTVETRAAVLSVMPEAFAFLSFAAVRFKDADND